MRCLILLALCSALIAAQAPKTTPQTVSQVSTQANLARMEATVLAMDGPNGPKDIASLSASIAALSADPWTRGRLAFRWVTAKIIYDLDAFFRHEMPAFEPKVVFTRRKATCMGMSAIYAAICAEMGLECQMVSGNIKSIGQAQGHAWNAIRLDGTWHIVDTTWGSGAIVQRAWKPWYQTGYYCADPEILRTSHFAMEKRWNLSPQAPKSSEEFLNLPQLMPAFAEVGLALEDSPKLAADGTWTFHLKRIGPGPTPAAELRNLNMQMANGRSFACEDATGVTVQASSPGKGDWLLWLWAGGRTIGIWILNSPTATPGPALPACQGPYLSSTMALIAPLTGTLKPGSTTFRISAPNAGSMSLMVNGRSSAMRKGLDGIWTGTAVVGSGPFSGPRIP